MRRAILFLLFICCPGMAFSQSTPRPVTVHAAVYELSLSKLRSDNVKIAGVSPEKLQALSFGSLLPSDPFHQAAPDDPQRNMRARLAASEDVAGVTDALLQFRVLKVIAAPTVMTTNGSPATYSAVGEAPVVVRGSDGRPAVDVRKFGTEFECLPVLLGNDRVLINIRTRISGIDVFPPTVIDGMATPGLHIREISTGTDMNIDQTFVATGLLDKRPVGNALEETEMVVTVRVELPEVPKIARRVGVN